MGKLNKIRRAVRKNPHLFKRHLYGRVEAGGAHVRRDRRGNVRVTAAPWDKSYRSFVASVLKEIETEQSALR